MRDHPIAPDDLVSIGTPLGLQFRENVSIELAASAINGELSGYVYDLDQDTKRPSDAEKKKWLIEFRDWVSKGLELFEGTRSPDLPDQVLQVALSEKGVGEEFGVAAAAIEEAAGGSDHPLYDEFPSRWHPHQVDCLFSDGAEELLNWFALAQAQLADVTRSTGAILHAFEKLGHAPLQFETATTRGRPKNVRRSDLVANLGEIYSKAYATPARFTVSTRSSDGERYGSALVWCRGIIQIAATTVSRTGDGDAYPCPEWLDLNEWATGPHALAETIKEIAQEWDGYRKGRLQVSRARAHRWRTLDPTELRRK